jgi:hypothetical protein
VVTGSKPKPYNFLYNVRCAAHRHCSNKKKQYLKAKINKPELGNNPHESKLHSGRK